MFRFLPFMQMETRRKTRPENETNVTKFDLIEEYIKEIISLDATDSETSQDVFDTDWYKTRSFMILINKIDLLNKDQCGLLQEAFLNNSVPSTTSNILDSLSSDETENFIENTELKTNGVVNTDPTVTDSCNICVPVLFSSVTEGSGMEQIIQSLTAICKR